MNNLQTQRQAAKTLKFNKEVWDEDIFVDIYERGWNELTEEQRAAAKVLGYGHGELQSRFSLFIQVQEGYVEQ